MRKSCVSIGAACAGLCIGAMASAAPVVYINDAGASLPVCEHIFFFDDQDCIASPSCPPDAAWLDVTQPASAQTGVAGATSVRLYHFADYCSEPTCSIENRQFQCGSAVAAGGKVVEPYPGFDLQAHAVLALPSGQVVDGADFLSPGAFDPWSCYPDPVGFPAVELFDFFQFQEFHGSDSVKYYPQVSSWYLPLRLQLPSGTHFGWLELSGGLEPLRWGYESQPGTAVELPRHLDDPCLVDATGDGSIDSVDLNIVLAKFGQATFEGDANGDGSVDSEDLNAVLGSFGQPCP